jgi:ribonucleoside-triphosphate reductase
VYYTNSTYLNVGSVLNPIDRVRKEGLFHPLIEAGSLTHIWLGESRPSGESLANFVIKVFRHSQNDQIAFSPEFTTCTACGQTSRGLSDHCSYCGSTEVEGITRITGYFTKVSSWNKGKLGELRDRYRSGGYFSAGGPADSQTDGEVSKWRGQASSANLVL